MITIKEEFVGGDKWRRAIELGGPEAILLWLAIKRYAAEYNTSGFVPDEEIDSLPGAPKKPRRLLPALTDCGRKKPDGTKGDGLLDPHPHGWMLHNYEDHANSAEEEELRRLKARERKRAYREQKAKELETLKGQRRDGVPRDCPTDVPGTDTGQNDGTEDGTVPRAGARAYAGGRSRNPTQPNPTQPEGEEIPLPPSEPEQPRQPLDAVSVASLRKPAQRFERSFQAPAAKRADVLELHAEWRKQFGRGNAPLVVGSNHENAELLADAIDAYGIADCLLVARNAKHDGMVSGRTDEQGNKHESIRYIFGNNETFSRILRDGKARELAAQANNPIAMIERLKNRQAGEA